jgi:hypothetical protein
MADGKAVIYTKNRMLWAGNKRGRQLAVGNGL